MSDNDEHWDEADREDAERSLEERLEDEDDEDFWGNDE